MEAKLKMADLLVLKVHARDQSAVSMFDIIREKTQQDTK